MLIVHANSSVVMLDERLMHFKHNHNSLVASAQIHVPTFIKIIYTCLC